MSSDNFDLEDLGVAFPGLDCRKVFCRVDIDAPDAVVPAPPQALQVNRYVEVLVDGLS